MASGNTNVFSVTFPYLDKTHVKVYVDGVERVASSLTWTSSYTVQLPDTAASLAGKTVRVQRVTPGDDSAVAFRHGGLSPGDLNTMGDQLLYLLQEAEDRAAREAEVITERAVQAANAYTDEKIVEIENGVIPAGAIDASRVSYRRDFPGAIRRAALDLVVGPDTVFAREFVNCDGTDETAQFQLFLNAMKNKRGILPQGEIRISQQVSIDPTANFILEGVGNDPNGAYTSRIRNTGTGHAIVVNDGGLVGSDNYRKFKGFALFGNQGSDDGLHLAAVHRTYLEDLWISTHGGNGILTYRGFSIKAHRVVSTQNGKCGIRMEDIPNAVTLLDCIFNGNSRLDGFSNIHVKGAAGLEALNVNIIGCDFTGAGLNPYPGVTQTASYGLLLEHVWSALVAGNYAEQVAAVGGSFLVYAGPTVRGLSFRENYMQDGRVLFDGVPELECVNNTFYGVTPGKTTALQVTNADADDQHVRRNILKGTAVETITGLLARKESYRTSAPVAGTWRKGDIVWNLNPVATGAIGWVCTVSGTPGTWKSFGAIAA